MLACQSRPVDTAGECSLYTLRQPFVLHSWNVTSLRNHRDAAHKVERVRSMADRGLVVIQETHLAANDPLTLGHALPHCDVRSSAAISTEKGGYLRWALLHCS